MEQTFTNYRTRMVGSYGVRIFRVNTIRYLFHRISELSNIPISYGSNTDDSFIMANWNAFYGPYEILPIAKENKYLRKFSDFIMKLYGGYSLEFSHRRNSIEYTQHIIIV